MWPWPSSTAQKPLHAQALLKSTPQGATGYLQADLRDPGVILRRAAEALDFGQPAAVTLPGCCT